MTVRQDLNYFKMSNPSFIPTTMMDVDPPTVQPLQPSSHHARVTQKQRAQRADVKAIFSRDSIYDAIFSQASPAGSILLSRTCRDARYANRDFNNRAFNINRHLGRFFKDPKGFRSLQARTGTLISGSNALQFFDRTYYPESDMDLFAHRGHSREIGF